MIDEHLDDVKSVIFTYSGNPTISKPAHRNDRPYIISFIKKEIVHEQGIKNKSYPDPKPRVYTIVHSHRFTEHCHLMKVVYPFYILGIIFLAFETAFYLVYTWYIRRRSSRFLQKALSLVPLYLLAYILIDFVYYMTCPWLHNNWIIYLQSIQTMMFLIVTPLIIALCWLVNMGYNILKTEFTKKEKRLVILIALGFSVAHLAYYIFDNILEIRIFLILFLTIMYF